MPERQLINICNSYVKGKQSVTLVEKIREADGTTRKVAHFDPDPLFSFYHSKEPKDVYSTSVPIDSVNKIQCKYSELFATIAKITKRTNWYNEVMSAGRVDNRKLGKLQFHKDLHSADTNLLDYLIRQYNETNENELAVINLDKAYFDIEVDTIDYDGFPDADVAPCPINFISYVNKSDKQLCLYILLNDDNKSMMDFIEKHNGDCTNHWHEGNNKWCQDALVEYFTDPKKPENTLEHVSIYWFKNELNLIKKFYDRVHNDRSDFLGG